MQPLVEFGFRIFESLQGLTDFIKRSPPRQGSRVERRNGYLRFE